MSDSKPTEDKRAREASALSSEYHKAHKQLMLWATILFIWEFVGVNLDEAKDAGGNIGPIVAAIKSPQAVPWVLLILVFYFLFKCSVEWAQCHVDRRRILFARIDYVAALIVSGAAITLYVGQTISNVQFANALQTPQKMRSTFAGIMIAAGVAIDALALVQGYVHRRTVPRRAYLLLIPLPLIALVYVWRVWRTGGLVWGFALLGMVVAGVLLGAPILGLFLHRRDRTLFISPFPAPPKK